MTHSLAHKKVIVFGGTGFIGRYVVQRLAKLGAIVGVPTRNVEAAKFLRPYGDVGQITPIACSVGSDADLRLALRGADAVVNLLGILYESGKSRFDTVHNKIPARIAAIAAECGVATMAHVSAIGASAKSDSHYAKSKFAGEVAVRDAKPDAVILRPSIVFGPEDGFFNLFAGLARMFHILPLIGGGQSRFQPVYVGDVADAVIQALCDPACRGKTYELGGPKIYSFAELMRTMLQFSRQKATLIPVPFWMAKIKAAFLQILPRPLLTVDQVRLLEKDNVANPSSLQLRDLGITPASLESILPAYMDRYYPGGKLADQNRAA